MESERGKEFRDKDLLKVINLAYTYLVKSVLWGIILLLTNTNNHLNFHVLQDDNARMREEIESLRRKYDALKGFANLKKIRLPAEYEQY